MSKDAEVQYSAFSEAHRVPMDPALQERIRRVGMSVVPAYQKQLKDDDPSKIRFRFYAVEDEKGRSEICSFEGLVLIPTHVVDRLWNDDQLAAVLADGVAYNLQLQGARMIAEGRIALGAEVGSDLAARLVPGLNLAVAVGSTLASVEIRKEMEEQRGRVALALIADAGYDPWQAPEAWRWLAPKQLPKKPNRLDYPSRSGYQLSILSLQYKKESATNAASAVPSAASEVK